MGPSSQRGREISAAQTDALPEYRRDIDGLRAVAVLLVISAHLRTRLTGGFVGVDVFFVISGYLISAAIIREMNQGSFTILGFYERRVRRIFPALIVLLLSVSVAAYHFLFPAELINFSSSLLSALFSVSNFWFWHQAGYFTASSALQPLLHTWSLAVEEQFYILFPLSLLAIRRFAPGWMKFAIWAATALTFVLAAICVRQDTTAAFFFSPIRAWELLLGTILSQKYLPEIRHAIGRNLASSCGLLLILVPSFWYSDITPFPGLAALPPCLGAVLIIAGGETGSSFAGRVLSWRPVVFIGLISYSLYLWHWPLIAFHNLGILLPRLAVDDRRYKLLIWMMSIALGTLSWRFVETPFRKGRLRPGRRALFLVNGLGAAAITLFALLVVSTSGMPRRFPPEALQAAAYLSYNPTKTFRAGVCFVGEDGDRDQFADFDQQTCLTALPDKRNVLLLGDSQAAQLWPGLSDVDPGVHMLQATVGTCGIFVGKLKVANPTCRHMADFIYNDYLIHHRVDAVILGGRWTNASIPGLTRTLAWMKDRGIKVYLLGPMIEYDQPFPRILAMSISGHQPALAASHRESPPMALDPKLAELARSNWGVPYISYYQNLCAPGCPLYAAPGVPLLFDTHHLTAQGAIVFVQSMRSRNQLPL